MSIREMSIRKTGTAVRDADSSLVSLGALGLQTLLFRAQLRAHGIHTSAARCEGRLPLLTTKGRLSLGSSFGLRSRVTRIELGAKSGARLDIGDNVFINQGASVVANLSISIGDDCLIGDYACLFDSNFHQVDENVPVSAAPIVLERNVWIGRGSVILPGVSIGKNSVVAAMSVVTKSVEPNTVVAGNPAVPVRSLTGGDWKRA